MEVAGTSVSSIRGVESECKKGHFGLSKVFDKKNPVDMMTKAVGAESMQQHLKFVNFRCIAGRADEASNLFNSSTPSLKKSRSWGGAGIRVQLYNEDDSAACVKAIWRCPLPHGYDIHAADMEPPGMQERARADEQQVPIPLFWLCSFTVRLHTPQRLLLCFSGVLFFRCDSCVRTVLVPLSMFWLKKTVVCIVFQTHRLQTDTQQHSPSQRRYNRYSVTLKGPKERFTGKKTKQFQIHIRIQDARSEPAKMKFEESREIVKSEVMQKLRRRHVIRPAQGNPQPVPRRARGCAPQAHADKPRGFLHGQ